MQTFTNKQIIIFTTTIGLIAGLFGGLVGVTVKDPHQNLQFPPQGTFVVPHQAAPSYNHEISTLIKPNTAIPEIGIPKHRWLVGRIESINSEENYLIIKSGTPEYIKEIKLVLTPEMTIKDEVEGEERTARDLRVGQYIVVESKEDVRDQKELNLIKIIRIIPPPTAQLPLEVPPTQ